jgi:hypothetical protein
VFSLIAITLFTLVTLKLVRLARTFRDPNGSDRVGMIVEIPDFAVFELLPQAAAKATRPAAPIHPSACRRLSERATRSG